MVGVVGMWWRLRERPERDDLFVDKNEQGTGF